MNLGGIEVARGNYANGEHKGYMLIREIVNELSRELALRQQVFPRLIQQGRLTTLESEERQERLSAAIFLLRRVSRIRPCMPVDHLADLLDRSLLTTDSVPVPQPIHIKGCV